MLSEVLKASSIQGVDFELAAAAPGTAVAEDLSSAVKQVSAHRFQGIRMASMPRGRGINKDNSMLMVTVMVALVILYCLYVGCWMCVAIFCR